MSAPRPAVDDVAMSAGSRVLSLGALLALGLAGFVVVASAYVSGGWLVERDESLAEWVAATMPTWAEWCARALSWVGGLVGTTAVAVVAVVVLRRRGRALDAALVVASVVGAQMLVLGLKHAYARPRPDAGSAVALPGSYSFPSGHAATGVALFALLGLLAAAAARTGFGRASWLVLGCAVGVAIGTSRIVLNVHYASDVVAGALLGLSWLAAVLLAGELVGRRGQGPAGSR